MIVHTANYVVGRAELVVVAVLCVLKQTFCVWLEEFFKAGLAVG